MDRFKTAETIKNAVIFSKVAEEPLIKELTELLSLSDDSREKAFELCCRVARNLYPFGDCLTERILELLSFDDNFYIKSVAKGEAVSEAVRQQAVRELEAFARAGALSSEYFSRLFKLSGGGPVWTSREEDFIAGYDNCLAGAAERGWGEFARWGVFTLGETGELVPVRNPDSQRMSELFGYEAQRETVVNNTMALLAGLPAANVLLYGDAGTGKSSTVKAVANELRPRGLRLIQVEKALLRHLPALLDELSENPLKFIIYIDDLSFEGNDRDFTALKTVLEGGVAARANNTVIYATSNRRHLIRESRTAREGDEIHLRDTLEETGSLSARFGLTVTFSRPDKEEYLATVEALAREFGLETDNEFFEQAEAWAIRAGGRTPRGAKQYVLHKKAQKEIR